MNAYEVVGRVMRLMAMSPVHSHRSTEVNIAAIIPPWALGQALLLQHEGEPVGWASWAFLGEDAEARFRDDLPLFTDDDWNSGDRLYLMDVIAPYGHGPQILRLLRARMIDEGRAGQRFFFRRNKAGKRRYSEASI